MAEHLIDGALRLRAIASSVVCGAFALLFSGGAVRLAFEQAWVGFVFAAGMAAALWWQTHRFSRKAKTPSVFAPSEDAPDA